MDIFVNSRFLLDDSVVVAKTKASGEGKGEGSEVTVEWHDLSRGRFLGSETVELDAEKQRNVPLPLVCLEPGHYEVRALVDGNLEASCCFYKAADIDWLPYLTKALAAAADDGSVSSMTSLLHAHLNMGGLDSAADLVPRLLNAAAANDDVLAVADAIQAVCRHDRVAGERSALRPAVDRLLALQESSNVEGADTSLGIAAALAGLQDPTQAETSLAEEMIDVGLASGEVAHHYWRWNPDGDSEIRQARVLSYLTAIERASWQTEKIRELSLARITNTKHVTKCVDPADCGSALVWADAALDWGNSAYVEGMMGKVAAEVEEGSPALLARVLSRFLAVYDEEAPWLEKLLSMPVPRMAADDRRPPDRGRDSHAFGLAPVEFYKPELTIEDRWKVQEAPEYKRSLGDGLERWAQHLRQYETFGEARCRYGMDLGPWDSKYYLPGAGYHWDAMSAEGSLSDKDRVRWLWILREMGRDLEWNQKYSTMVVHNAGATMIGALGKVGHYFEHFPEAAAWRKLARDRLEWMFTGLLDDGGWYEGTPGYHCFAIVGFYDYFKAAKLIHDQDLFSLEFDGKSVGMMLEWIVKEMTPLRIHTCNNDGQVAEIDRNKLLELAELGGNGEYVYLCGTRAGEPGPKFGKTVARVPDFTSVLLPDTGWAVMRDGWKTTDQYLCLDFGPKGGGHGHFDKGNIEVFANGYGWVLDNGYGNGTTLRHNTVVVDGQSQAEVTGELIDFHTGPDVDIASCKHAGYQELGVAHRRTVVYLRSKVFAVFDRLDSSDGEEHAYAWRAQTKSTVASCEAGRTLFCEDDAGMVIANSTPKAFCRFGAQEFQHFNRSTCEYYQGGKWGNVPYEDGMCVEYEHRSADTFLPLEFVLVPYTGDESEVTCERLPASEAQVIRLTIDSEIHLIGVADSPSGKARVQAGGVETDAAYFVVGGIPEDLSLITFHRGSTLSFGPWQIAARDGKATTMSVKRVSPGGYEVTSDSAVEIEMPAGMRLVGGTEAVR